MSGRGKGGKGLGKKQRVAEYEWTSGEEVYELAFANGDDCEINIYTIPKSKMDPVIMHVVNESGAKTFTWDIGQADNMDDFFENLTQKKFDSLTGDDEDEDEEGEEEEDEEEVDDRDSVIDYLRDWIINIPSKFAEPVGVPVKTVAKIGIFESV